MTASIDPVSIPLVHLAADEQLALIAASLPGTHDDDRWWLHTASPLWTALEVLRADGGWLTWADHARRTATVHWLASGGACPASWALDLAARAVRRLSGWLRHTGPDGRAVEISPPPPGAPWWAWRHRARTFSAVLHDDGPPLYVAEPSRLATPLQLPLIHDDCQEAA